MKNFSPDEREDIFDSITSLIDDELKDMVKYMNYSSYFRLLGDKARASKFLEMARDEQKHATYLFQLLNDILNKKGCEIEFPHLMLYELNGKILNERYNNDLRNNFATSINGEIEAIKEYKEILPYLRDEFNIDIKKEWVSMMNEIINDEEKHRRILLSFSKQAKLF